MAVNHPLEIMTENINQEIQQSEVKKTKMDSGGSSFRYTNKQHERGNTE